MMVRRSTPSICVQQCYTESFDVTGPGPFEELAVEGSRGKEGVSSQTTENARKRPVHTRNVEVLLSLARAKAKKFLKDTEKEKQEGIQGQWQRESSADADSTSKI